MAYEEAGIQRNTDHWRRARQSEVNTDNAKSVLKERDRAHKGTDGDVSIHFRNSGPQDTNLDITINYKRGRTEVPTWQKGA